LATEYEREQSGRDNGLIRRMCYVQESQASYIQTWMQEELESLRNRAQMLRLMTLTDNAAKRKLTECDAAIARVYAGDMAEAFKRLDERRAEVESEMYDDPLESEQHLNDGLRAILDLMRSVIGMRYEVDKLWKACTTKPGD
jgi:hypothetical protein